MSNRGVPLEEWQKLRDKDVHERIRRKQFRRPLTKNHQDFLKAIERHDITLVIGPAGTGKTSLACQVAIRLFMEGKIEQIVMARPLVECDGELGFLPGNVDEKLAFFTAPMQEALKRALGPQEFAKARQEGRIVICPLEQMRGKTFENAVVIIDEAANATYRQLHMALTRVGDDCHIVICGDVRQSDLEFARENPEAVPLLKVARILSRLNRPEIAICTMDGGDVLRPEIVNVIDEALSCGLTPTLPTTTTGPSVCEIREPVPSYGEMVVELARENQNSSSCSKKRVLKRRLTA